MQTRDWRKDRLFPGDPQEILEGPELARFLVALEAEKESGAVHFIKFLLLGGWRMSSAAELTYLRWEGIDFERGSFKICLPPNRKNITVLFLGDMDKPTTVFLQELYANRKDGSSWAFPTSPGKKLLAEVRAVLRRVSKRTGREGVTLNALKWS
jgi:hypothetical protein